jgi:hypothetical protein
MRRWLTPAGEYAGQISWFSPVAYLNLGGAGAESAILADSEEGVMRTGNWT